tara:strand:+ start:3815 stop:4267 length:453 start_codon:yes stop_codon:yes gene_type:complete
MPSDFISSGIQNILKDGIYLHLETKEEEQYYASKLHQYFEEETEFRTYLGKGNVIEVESFDMTLAVEILITDSTLYLVPYVSDIFEIFTEVLKFIAYKHELIMTEFRGIEVTKIQSVNELNRANNEKTEQQNRENNTEEEPSSDDDYEWI